MGTQLLSLKWKNHHNNIIANFKQLFNNEALVDMTLACEGHSIKVHKVVLSACSPFFQNLLLENPCQHPIVILSGIKYKDLKTIIDFIYHGEVNIGQDQLNTLLQTAESLKVNGLTEISQENESNSGENDDLTDIADNDLSCSSPHSDAKSANSRRKKQKSVFNNLYNNCNEQQISPKIEPSTSISPELIAVTPDIVVESNSTNNSIIPANSIQNQYSTNSVFNSMASYDITNSTSHTLPTLHSQSMELPSNVNIKISEHCSSKCVTPNLELHNSTSERTSSHQPVFSQLAISSVSITECQLQPSSTVMNSDKQVICELPGPSNYLQVAVQQEKQLIQKKENFTSNSYSSQSGSLSPLNVEDSLKNLCCPYCKKVYSQNSSLKRHMEIHMLERKTYRCFICQKRFSWKNYLHLHLKRDHGVNLHRN